MNQKRLEFTGVGPVEDIWLTAFFGDDRLLDSSVIAVASSVGCASLESTCELINLGGGDGGSSMMVVWPVACASWLVLAVAVGVSEAGFKSFLLWSQDLKVNLCGLQQDIHSDSVK